jgi:hypothetical protein
MALCVSWVDSPGVKVPRRLSRTCRESLGKVPLLRDESSTLGRWFGEMTGRLECLPLAEPS